MPRRRVAAASGGDAASFRAGEQQGSQSLSGERGLTLQQSISSHGHEMHVEGSNKQPVRNNVLAKGLIAANELTKWLVSGVALYILIMHRNTVQVPLAILGSILNVIVCKVLKVVINEQRPPYARKADPGMPSSHAQSLGFLGVYFALCMLWGDAAGSVQGFTTFTAMFYYPYQVFAGVVTLAIAVFMAWLRVHSGYHTGPQVLVGFSLGSLFAVAWRQFAVPMALPATAADPQLHTVIKIMTWAVVAAFAGMQLFKLPQSVQQFHQQMSS